MTQGTLEQEIELNKHELQKIKFDTNILSNYDYIFFYTGYMDHATYYRAINFIRSYNIKFGYIGKTNMELVEDELIDELEKIK